MSRRSQHSERMIPDRFIQLVLEEAKDLSAVYQEDRQDEYYQGKEQPYTEVFDLIQDCDIDKEKT